MTEFDFVSEIQEFFTKANQIQTFNIIVIFFLLQDEILYQETRRLVGAEMQNIVYGEYLPTILGVDFMKSYDLIVAEETKYDPNVDSSIFNAFATAAFRQFFKPH